SGTAQVSTMWLLIEYNNESSNEYVTISVNTANNDLYVMYLRSGTVYYKKYTASAWGSETDTSWTEGSQPKFLTSNYGDSGRIYAVWTSGTANPYTINWNYIIMPEKLLLLLLGGILVWNLIRSEKRKRTTNQ
ncbi:MAG TPA: hypothetical protein VJ179_02420, partial [Patescibacteria group bacterium]|nr:hypothetical protein [Patescibacteria group bacterium]